jgi:hypothetical protein
MTVNRSILATGIVLAAATAQATSIGFGQLGGNNTQVPTALGSNATADGNGYVVSIGGATPNIGLSWDVNWDIHTSSHFTALENQTEGGGSWDNEGNVPRIGQLDFGAHSVTFSADAGFAFVLNSFDFAHTAETPGTTEWGLTLTAVSSSAVVWSDSVTFVNGQVNTFAPNFTGTDGESYTLAFNRASETYNANGRHGIDNLNFSQVVAVPEPTAASLVALAGLAWAARGRRRS